MAAGGAVTELGRLGDDAAERLRVSDGGRGIAADEATVFSTHVARSRESCVTIESTADG